MRLKQSNEVHVQLLYKSEHEKISNLCWLVKQMLLMLPAQ